MHPLGRVWTGVIPFIDTSRALVPGKLPGDFDPVA